MKLLSAVNRISVYGKKVCQNRKVNSILIIVLLFLTSLNAQAAQV